MTDKSDARERAREVLAQISERDGHLGAAKQLRDPDFELNKEDGSKTAIDAMLAFATPLPEAVPAADLEREAREVLATELERADPDYEWEASNIRIGSGGEKWDCAIRAMLAFRDAGRGAVAQPPASGVDRDKLLLAIEQWDHAGGGYDTLTDRILALTNSGAPVPVDMLLFCPKCGLQHIDEPDERTPDWSNPPHRSHLCHACGCIWRPADVPTNGVVRIATEGKADTWGESNSAALAARTQQPSPASAGECDCAARFYGDDRNAHQLCCAVRKSSASAKREALKRVVDDRMNLTGEEMMGAILAALTPDAGQAETYRHMHDFATRELGYPSILEALEAAPHADAGQGVLEEREACAAIADAHGNRGEPINNPASYRTASEHIAAAIRARSPASPDGQEGGGDA